MFMLSSVNDIYEGTWSEVLERCQLRELWGEISVFISGINKDRRGIKRDTKM